MAREPVKYDIPPGTEVIGCRGCHAPIAFIRTPSGKSMPVDGDGTPHWATCKEPAQFRRGRNVGNH